MAHEPSSPVGNADHTANPMRAHALLGRAQQMVDQQPLAESNLGALKHGANGDGELLAAVIALDQSGAVMGALKARGVERTAMRAERTIGPLNSFQMCAGCVSVGGEGCSDVQANHAISTLLYQVYDCHCKPGEVSWKAKRWISVEQSNYPPGRTNSFADDPKIDRHLINRLDNYNPQRKPSLTEGGFGAIKK